MKSLGEAVADVIVKAAEANPPKEDDYINPTDGLRYCGKCHTPKETARLFMGNVMNLPINCKCRDEEFAEMRRIKEKERIELLKQEGFVDPAMEECRFEKDGTPESKESVACRSYVEHFDDFYQKGKGLVFTGAVGTGKTFYASCIANALMEKLHPVLVTSISRYIRSLEGEYGNRNENIDYLRRFELVVFDDLGVERNTPYVNELVYAIIDGRVRSRKPMIVTTNVSLDVLKQTENIPVESARIYDRILSACIPLPFDGTNRRREEAREDYKKFKNILGI